MFMYKCDFIHRYIIYFIDNSFDLFAKLFSFSLTFGDEGKMYA